jgi:hypothetical protein
VKYSSKNPVMSSLGVGCVLINASRTSEQGGKAPVTGAAHSGADGDRPD